MDIEALTLWTRYALGRLTVKDGSLCKFSRRFFDIHDFEPRKGGDGIDLPGKIHHCPYPRRARGRGTSGHDRSVAFFIQPVAQPTGVGGERTQPRRCRQFRVVGRDEGAA